MFDCRYNTLNSCYLNRHNGDDALQNCQYYYSEKLSTCSYTEFRSKLSVVKKFSASLCSPVTIFRWLGIYNLRLTIFQISEIVYGRNVGGRERNRCGTFCRKPLSKINCEKFCSTRSCTIPADVNLIHCSRWQLLSKWRGQNQFFVTELNYSSSEKNVWLSFPHCWREEVFGS